MLAACGKETPETPEVLRDPCARIVIIGPEQELRDPNSAYSQEWRRKCEELRREQAAKVKK
jgi:hypothetical protein